MNLLFALGIFGCLGLGILGLFIFNDGIEEWEDHKLEHDRRKHDDYL